MRNFLIKAHATLAAFFFPVGVMFLVTGALYTIGDKGSYETETHAVQLTEPLTKDLAKLVAIAQAELDSREIAHPTGGASIKSIGSGFRLEWTGSVRDVLLKPGAGASFAVLEVKNTTWHRRFVQLHKAKGGDGFKGFAVVWSAGLLLLFLSGFMLALQLRAIRKTVGVAFVLGVVTFTVTVLLS